MDRAIVAVVFKHNKERWITDFSRGHYVTGKSDPMLFKASEARQLAASFNNDFAHSEDAGYAYWQEV